jgi:hypothetical protein
VKRKSSARVEPAHTLVSPAAQEFVQAAADRVGPLVHQAADRVGPLAHSAADRINAATVALSPYAQNAADRVGPLAQQAVDRVTPYTQQAVELVTPYAQHAADLVAPYTAKVAPYASSARQKGAQAAHDAVEALAPRLDEAFDRVTPAVEAARGKVTDELLPRLSEALTAAAATPVAVEAARRGKATMAAARGELSFPEPKKKGRWLRRFAIIAAVAGVAVVVLRRVLGDKDADWQAARPTTPYAPSTPASPSTSAPSGTAAASASTTAAAADAPSEESAAPAAEAVDDAVLNDTVATETGADDTGNSATLGSDIVTDGDLVAEEAAGTDESSIAADLPTDAVEESAQTPQLDESEIATEELAPVASTEGSDSDGTSAEQKYTGEGAYVGNEPPEGFFIKGNENSMKYHLPESGGYDDTVAEVWFSSEEAAQQAGFVRAQG